MAQLRDEGVYSQRADGRGDVRCVLVALRQLQTERDGRSDRLFDEAVAAGDFQRRAKERLRVGPGALDVADGAAAMAQKRQAVIAGCRGVAAAHAAGVDALDLAGQPTRVVEVVNHQVEDEAAGARVVQQPVRGAGPGLKAAARQAQHSDLADVAAGHAGLRRGVFREEAQHVADQQLHAGLLAGAQHGLAFAQAARQRLLYQQMSARRGGLQRDFAVLVGRRADVDHIHHGDEFGERAAGVGLDLRSQLARRLRPGGIDCGDARRRGGPGPGVRLCHEARADNADAHSCSPLSDCKSIAR